MVCTGPGPDAIQVPPSAAAAADGAPRPRLRPSSTRSTPDAGWIFKKGANRLRRRTVVHINAGIAGLVGALLIGKRVGYGRS